MTAQPGVDIRLALAVCACMAGPVNARAQCSQLLQAVAPGQALKAEDLQPAPCTPALLHGALRHDSAHHITRARMALAPGDLVPAVAPNTLARHAAGDTVLVRARVGPVQVQRQAQVLAPAADGARVLMLADRRTVVAASGNDVSAPR